MERFIDFIMLEKIKKKMTVHKYSKLIYQSDVFLAIAINTFFFVLGLICFDLKYEVSDDFVMASIMSGAFGDTPNPQMIFVNVIIGYLLLPFYKLLPQISWYFIAQLLLVFISSISVTWVLLKKMERIKAVMLSVILILFFTNDAYILMQFTKTSMFAVIAGSMIFIWEIFREHRKIPLLFGSGLCLIGTMVRFQTIYLAGAFLVLMIGYESVNLFYKLKALNVGIKQIMCRFIFIGLAGLLLIVSAYGLERINWYTYNNDEEYGNFSAYNEARSGIVDFEDPGYQIYESELQKVGISENDYNLLKKWGFADNDFFTIERMQQTAEVIKRYYKSQSITFRTLLERFQSRQFQKYPVCIACILILFLGIFLNYKKWWLSIGSISIGIGLLLYFSYRERSIYRVEYDVFLGMFLCMVYFWERNYVIYTNTVERKISGAQNTTFLQHACRGVILLCILGNILVYIPDSSYRTVSSETRKDYIDEKFYDSWNFVPGKYRRVVNKDVPKNNLLEEFELNPDNYYFMDFNTTIQTLYFAYPPWKALPIGYYSNFSYLSGITSNFPDCVHQLEEREVENPLKSLVKENVYLVDNQNLEIKLNYLREHYYPNARAELYKTLDGYQVWKLYEE